MSFIHNKFEIQRNSIPQDYRRDVYFNFFAKENINYISNEITIRLTGVHPENKNIIVPDDTILSVMDSIYSNTYKDVDKLTMTTISYIVEYISAEFETEKKNNELSIWVINQPPEYKMQRTPEIKLREKRPPTALWNNNY